ncbi:MAG TPA: hypothetical protein VF600_04780 [Abditibacteriaceae bacterium]
MADYLSPVVQRLGYDEMLSHEFLTADHAVQRTRWKSGAETIVNFGPNTFKISGGREVKPLRSITRYRHSPLCFLTVHVMRCTA